VSFSSSSSSCGSRSASETRRRRRRSRLGKSRLVALDLVEAIGGDDHDDAFDDEWDWWS
jgi:hypothetical protein